MPIKLHSSVTSVHITILFYLTSDQHVSPRHRATKIKHQLSLSEMAQQGTKEMIAEKIHRRLQTQISDNRGNDSTVLGNNQTASESVRSYDIIIVFQYSS